MKVISRSVFLGFFRGASLVALILVLVGVAQAGEYFRVDMVKPQHFIIETLVPGSVGTSSRGPSTQIRLHQQHGRTMVHAIIPPGAELQVTVGSHRLHLRMIDDENYQVQED